MKGQVIVAIILAIGATYFYMNATPTTTPLEDEYHQFLATYRKGYMSGPEYEMRFKIFSENMKAIEEHNAKDLPHKLGVNQFADMTQEEFKKHLQYKPIRNKKPAEPLTGVFAASVDWREKNAVNPVQNQGMCGSCWAFSATGAVEGSYAIATGDLVKFSEQQLVDCSTDGNQGCNGGLMDNAFKYLMHNDFCYESAYPYTAKDETCKADQCGDKKVRAVADFTDVSPDNVEALKEALNKGPVSVAVEADKKDFQFYTSGIIEGDGCGASLNHGVLAVGYGNENGEDYFIVKNSWGATWGEQGYVRIGTKCKSDHGVCGILEDASFTTS